MQVHTFYEAVGLMISAQVDQIVQDLLIEKYMMLPNQVWDDIINSAAKVCLVNISACVWIFGNCIIPIIALQNVDILKNPEVVKQLASILKTNESACRSLGHTYVIQVSIITSS